MNMYQWWELPVIDRTLSDVEYRTSKGVLNARDLTRIEGNVGTLARQQGIMLNTKKWDIGDNLTNAELQRIIFNINTIKDLYKQDSKGYNTLLYWEDTNEAERILKESFEWYKSLMNWYCWECIFDSWQTFDNAVYSWSYFNNHSCDDMVTWKVFEQNFDTWIDFESKVDSWLYFECKGGKYA